MNATEFCNRIVEPHFRRNAVKVDYHKNRRDMLFKKFPAEQSHLENVTKTFSISECKTGSFKDNLTNHSTH